MKLYRASGNPIKEEHIESFYRELHSKMDELESMMGKCTQENAHEFKESLDDINSNLLKTYPNEVVIDFPNTVKSMSKFTQKYGACAFCVEDDKLVCYIMDS